MLDQKRGNSPRAFYPPGVVMKMSAAENRLPLRRRVMRLYEAIRENLANMMREALSR